MFTELSCCKDWRCAGLEWSGWPSEAGLSWLFTHILLFLLLSPQVLTKCWVGWIAILGEGGKASPLRPYRAFVLWEVAVVWVCWWAPQSCHSSESQVSRSWQGELFIPSSMGESGLQGALNLKQLWRLDDGQGVIVSRICFPKDLFLSS